LSWAATAPVQSMDKIKIAKIFRIFISNPSGWSVARRLNRADPRSGLGSNELSGSIRDVKAAAAVEASKRSFVDNVANDPSPRAVAVVRGACMGWSESLDRRVFAAFRTFVRKGESDMAQAGEHSKCEKNIEEASACVEEYVYDRGKHHRDPQPCGKHSGVSIDDDKEGIRIALHCLMRPDA